MLHTWWSARCVNVSENHSYNYKGVVVLVIADWNQNIFYKAKWNSVKDTDYQ